MEDTFLQTALRELKVFTGSPRFWLTFIAVVLLFAMTGPYGTQTHMSFGPRLGFWFVIHGTTWAIAITCIVLFDILFLQRISSRYLRILGGALLSSIPIGISVEYLASQWTGTKPDMVSIGFGILNALPLTLVFSLITSMTMSSELQTRQIKPDEMHPGAEADRSEHALPENETESTSPGQHSSSPQKPPIMDRLKPENRGPLLLMSVEDHYVHVTTTRGHELVLLRFSDALKEVGQTDGMQVHRSHWVADAYVTGLKSEAGKLSVILQDGRTIPVSRPYAETTRNKHGKTSGIQTV